MKFLLLLTLPFYCHKFVQVVHTFAWEWLALWSSHSLSSFSTGIEDGWSIDSGLPWWFRGERICLQSKRELQLVSQEDPLEKAMATHSSILAWRISWTEEAGGLGHEWATKYTQIRIPRYIASLIRPEWNATAQ